MINFIYYKVNKDNMYRIAEHSGSKMELDVKDKKLLVLLSEDSRQTINDLAKKVRLKRDTVAYRLKRMEKQGIILRYYPTINYEMLGYHQFHVFFVVDEANEGDKQKFIECLKNYPGTLSMMEYSDRWDFEWVFLAKSLGEFDHVVNVVCGNFSNIIQERLKLIHRSNFYSILLPYDFHDMKRKQKHFKMPKKRVDADKKDRKILKELSLNARQSTYELSKKIGLSPDAIRVRIKRLEESNVIVRYTVLLNLSVLGYHLYTFAQQMKNFDKHSEAKFRTLVEDHPHIIKAVKALGPWDLLVYIIADSSKNFHKTIKQLKSEFSQTIGSYATFVAYEEHMFEPFPSIMSKYS